jgi:uncharacterized protein (DUF1778 family)
MKSANLMVRMDSVAKKLVTRAATLRGISTSDWVRDVITAQAAREVTEADERTVKLSREDQLRFWEALQRPVRLTRRQRELSRLMKGH